MRKFNNESSLFMKKQNMALHGFCSVSSHGFSTNSFLHHKPRKARQEVASMILHFHSWKSYKLQDYIIKTYSSTILLLLCKRVLTDVSMYIPRNYRSPYIGKCQDVLYKSVSMIEAKTYV